MTGSPSFQIDDGLALITLDDGKANAISHAVLAGLSDALDRAEAEARAVVIVGREGRFSAGFDLAAMTESAESMRELVISGAQFLVRLFGLGMPTVAACTGHALAAGALTLLACDTRIGADVPAKIGLNEVAIGMPLPVFAVELARARVPASHFTAATVQGTVYDPAGAVAAGYLDRVVPADQVLDAALAEARRLAEIRTGAYARTKQAARGALIDLVVDTLEADMATITPPGD